MKRVIEVHADWNESEPPQRVGILNARPGPTGDLFDFTFDDRVLADVTPSALYPDMGLFAGPQFPKSGHTLFGVFKDSSPDRWGRTLIRRRFERDKRAGRIPADSRLGEADYLLGVHDPVRSGALRYRMTPDGPFLDNRAGDAATPFAGLGELEAAIRGIEDDRNNDDPAADEWLRVLLAPGAALGGARPKATVVDADGRLWLAKFPSTSDRYDIGAWELVAQRLAARAGLRVSPSDARVLGGTQHTFMLRRFDRHASGARIHFASAMTVTGHEDGDGAPTGASYLEIAEVIAAQGASPREDLVELWSRLVFNVMISNTDDHLRNHGFLLVPRAGWRLSDAYDINPVAGSSGLALNIDETDNALDLDLVRSVAPHFRIKGDEAAAIVARIATAVGGWRDVAESIGIKRSEQEEMADAFASR